MPIGLTARQKAELSAMLPHIEESIAALKRLIADTKDRTRALQRLSEAEEAQKRHARDVGVPFNAEAFAARRAELESLPKTLTIEDGQLAAFTSLGRAIGVVLEGPYTREGRGGGGARGAAKGGKARARGGAAGPGKSAARKGAKAGKAAPGKSSPKKAAKSPAKSAAKPAGGGATKRGTRPERQDETRIAAPARTSAPVRRIKPLPLALGS